MSKASRRLPLSLIRIKAATAEVVMAVLRADSETAEADSSSCMLLDCDALAGVMALARPQDAVSVAQSCKELHKAHQALKANLNLDGLRQLSRQHVLGVAPDTAYVQLAVPEELVRLAAHHLTTLEIHNVVLAMRPELRDLRAFAQRMFRDHLSTSLVVTLVVPGSVDVISRRVALAPVLHALTDIVTRDLKLVISSYAQVSQPSTSLKVNYDLDVSVQAPDSQGLDHLYLQVMKELGQIVADTIFDIQLFQCEMTGVVVGQLVSWKESGLPALFGRHAALSDSELSPGISSVDCEESASAQCWRFSALASQIVPVYSISDQTTWL